jgi:hypothetical protein
MLQTEMTNGFAWSTILPDTPWNDSTTWAAM